MRFITQRVSDEAGLREIYRLRYKVYVEEWGFEKPEEHPDGLETNEYDKTSVHFVTKDAEGQIVGTVRLILNSPIGFPIERYCGIDINKNDISREKIVEISRLAISKAYRRRAEDRYIFGPDEERRSIGSFDNYEDYNHKFYRRAEDKYKYDFLRTGRVFNENRIRSEIVLSLCKAIYDESRERGLTHWYAVMTKGLYIHLRKLGINFQPIGEPIDYHGIRTPYIGEIKGIEQEMSIKNPELYEEFTKK